MGGHHSTGFSTKSPMIYSLIVSCWTHHGHTCKMFHSHADSTFGSPGKIDNILGAELFNVIMHHGRRYGPRGSPTALGDRVWLSSQWCRSTNWPLIAICHSSTSLAPGTLRCFWEIDETSRKTKILTSEEKFVVNHFQRNHTRDTDGRFIVPLPRKTDSAAIGDYRSQAVRCMIHQHREVPTCQGKVCRS